MVNWSIMGPLFENLHKYLKWTQHGSFPKEMQYFTNMVYLCPEEGGRRHRIESRPLFIQVEARRRTRATFPKSVTGREGEGLEEGGGAGLWHAEKEVGRRSSYSLINDSTGPHGNKQQQDPKQRHKYTPRHKRAVWNTQTRVDATRRQKTWPPLSWGSACVNVFCKCRF